jgi:hypothetical protein
MNCLMHICVSMFLQASCLILLTHERTLIQRLESHAESEKRHLLHVTKKVLNKYGITVRLYTFCGKKRKAFI